MRKGKGGWKQTVCDWEVMTAWGQWLSLGTEARTLSVGSKNCAFFILSKHHWVYSPSESVQWTHSFLHSADTMETSCAPSGFLEGSRAYILMRQDRQWTHHIQNKTVCRKDEYIWNMITARETLKQENGLETQRRVLCCFSQGDQESPRWSKRCCSWQQHAPSEPCGQSLRHTHANAKSRDR